MTGGAKYDDAFHDEMGAASLVSAAEIVPLVLAIAGPVGSVVDVGCGIGAWLSMFAASGADHVLGLDGDSVDRGKLLIPAERFVPCDLAQPLAVEGRFDLAVSLEVAEHLPARRAAGFVDDLVRLAPIVLFSAAVPGQRGLGHVHERWPSHWARLFRARGFLPVDAIRRRVWSNDKVSWWYRQNLLLFAAPETIDARPALAAARAETNDRQLSLVHPVMYSTLFRDYADIVHRHRTAQAEIARLKSGRPADEG